MAAVSELLRNLLEKRGITDTADVAAFLAPDYELHTHSPFLLAGMEEALDRVFTALDRDEKIAIYADFDCDGIPGAALLSDFFKRISYSNVEIYIPHRDREGYGFHADAIRELATRGVSLIITVDVGTTAREPVALARELGIDVIVTDHHEITGELPDALAVLNPKRAPLAPSEVEGYPYPSLCGTGVAFKFVQAILARGRERGIERFTPIPDGWEKWLLDLVAIATVADMVPLAGENRVLVYWGLSVLRKTRRPGLRALIAKLRLTASAITEDDIAFSIAPRINAASRMDDPDLALRLLTTEDSDEAESIAGALEALNTRRKGVVGGIVRQVRQRASVRTRPEDRVIVLGDPAWKPALLGLAANSIVNDHGGVVCLWGRDAAGRIKGSCRSDGALSVVDVFAGAAAALSEYGGHAASGGFTVADGSIHTLPDAFSAAAQALPLRALEAKRPFDALVSIREIAEPLFREIAQLAPFGLGNPKPVFCLREARIISTRRFGKSNDHIEVHLACPETDARLRGYDFFRTPEQFTRTPAPGETARILGTIERDTYRRTLAFRLVDILPA